MTCPKTIVRFGIRPGMTVEFRHQGIVNRINRQATVLIEDRRAERCSDGKRYAKFYVLV
jgi:hypothetical protein